MSPQKVLAVQTESGFQKCCLSGQTSVDEAYIACDLCILLECDSSLAEAVSLKSRRRRVAGSFPRYLGSSENVNITFCFLNLCQDVRCLILIDVI